MNNTTQIIGKIVAADTICEILEANPNMTAHQAAAAVTCDDIDWDSAVALLYLSFAADGYVAAIRDTVTDDALPSTLDHTFANLDVDQIPLWRPELRDAILNDAPVDVYAIGGDDAAGLRDLAELTAAITGQRHNPDELAASTAKPYLDEICSTDPDIASAAATLTNRTGGWTKARPAGQ